MSKAAEPNDRNFVTALARGLEILRCFSAEQTELGTTDLARMTGMAQSTVWRLCHTLQQLGYLVPAANPERLRIGLDVLALGGASITRVGIASAAYPEMVEIAQRFNTSLSLAGRSGHHMIIVQRAEAPGMLRLNFSVGTMLPLGSSGVGAAYLAATQQEDRREIMKQMRTRTAGAWPETKAWLEASMQMYQQHGYVLNIRRLHPDICAAAVPIVSRDGKTVMAINCGGPCSRITQEQLTGPIAEALKGIAGRLQSLI